MVASLQLTEFMHFSLYRAGCWLVDKGCQGVSMYFTLVGTFVNKKKTYWGGVKHFGKFEIKGQNHNMTKCGKKRSSHIHVPG